MLTITLQINTDQSNYDKINKLLFTKKGMDWVQKVMQVHETCTTEPIVAGNYFAVGRALKLDEIMLYHVKDGKIAVEQFFY